MSDEYVQSNCLFVKTVVYVCTNVCTTVYSWYSNVIFVQQLTQRLGWWVASSLLPPRKQVKPWTFKASKCITGKMAMSRFYNPPPRILIILRLPQKAMQRFESRIVVSQTLGACLLIRNAISRMESESRPNKD